MGNLTPEQQSILPLNHQVELVKVGPAAAQAGVYLFLTHPGPGDLVIGQGAGAGKLMDMDEALPQPYPAQAAGLVKVCAQLLLGKGEGRDKLYGTASFLFLILSQGSI